MDFEIYCCRVLGWFLKIEFIIWDYVNLYILVINCMLYLINFLYVIFNLIICILYLI